MENNKNLVPIEKLLESGAHFGHLTRRWNPKMEQFIFMERNGIHILDLRKTQVLLKLALDAVVKIAETGRTVLFVGTKPQAKESIEEEAKRAGTNYVCERWLGGMLTNFTTIRKSIKRLATIDKMEVDGTFEKITKKERLLITRERDRLRKVFGGIESMTRLPGALFVVDIKKEHLAIKEAKILNIPVFGIVDTNTDPEIVDYPIPANDDSTKTVKLIASLFADVVSRGVEISKIRAAEMSAEKDRIAKEQETSDDSPQVKRQFRERKPRRGKKAEQNTNEDNNQSKTEETPADTKKQEESSKEKKYEK